MSVGVKFVSDLLYAWWKKLDQTVNEDASLDTSGGRIVHHDHSFNLALHGSPHNGSYLPPPLYISNPIGLCTRCEALADDAGELILAQCCFLLVLDTKMYVFRW